MNIDESKKNLLAHLHILPDNIKTDVKFLLEKLDEIVREVKELKRRTVVKNKVEDFSHEIWRDVVNYEGLYQVSNFGRVKSFYGIGENLLTPSANKSGYQYVVLTKNKVRKSCKVHTLVACAFLVNLENKPAVHHRDGNRSNNRVDNLEWVTYRENSAYAVQMGRYNKKDTFSIPQAKLTSDNVIYIRTHYIPRHREFGANALARKFNVCTNTIYNVVNYITHRPRVSAGEISAR